MSQQQGALQRMNGKRWYGLTMEMGTGKTWSLLADVERYYSAGKIDGAFVVAPNGVHENWVLREMPLHMNTPYVAYAWRTGMGKADRAKMERDLLTPTPPGEQRPLRVFTINYESLARSADAFAFCERFMLAVRCMYILDESQMIKNPKALVSKKIFELRKYAPARRISTGTPMDKPPDIFNQFEFMKEGLLGTSSYRAFMAEYALLADFKTPITSADFMMKAQVKANPRMAWATIVVRDEETGLPVYRNLDKLAVLVAEHTYRVLKTDCLDLPPKIYTNHYFELTAAQRRAYDLMEEEMRIEAEDGTLTAVSALTKFVKLQQITSGYVIMPGEVEPRYIGADNPRIAAVVERLNLVQGRAIVWCKFREELRALAAALSAAGRRVVEYHGGVKRADRNAAIDAIQSGTADVFLGIQKAGGTGLTLTNAETTIYCSNEHSRMLRAQSEDRNHRIGTRRQVLYIDVMARNTIDESIAKCHQWKENLAATILRDRQIDLRRVFAG